MIGLERALLRLRPAAEAVQVLMMLAMFVAFILQVVFRYVVNLPLAWTEEVCTLAWIWGVTWGASFVMRNSDDMRFDLVITVLSPGLRRWLACFSSFALVLIFGISIPATWSYISFMKVESSASLGIPLNLVFACYMLFVLALMVRHALIGVHALRGDPDDLTGLPS